jgi:predicted ATPase
MRDFKIVLNKVHINNFLSLHNVVLPIKSLTILVGPNASGKTNVLEALKLLKEMMVTEEPPEARAVQDMFWARSANSIDFQLEAQSGEKPITYKLGLRIEKGKSQFYFEELTIDSVKVISVKKGRGEVRDEDDKNPLIYRSTKLALKSAGNYGNKPLTNALADFIRGWEFYDFDPHEMRSGIPTYSTDILTGYEAMGGLPRELDDNGSKLGHILMDWSITHPQRFEVINEVLERCSDFSLERRDTRGKSSLYLLQGYENPIPLGGASDGTVRLLAYLVLLNQPELPSLIAIEEPERNLHPGLFMELGRLLNKLSQRTQVIITTHSSQLLDTFNAEDLTDTLEVLLLRNEPGRGTQAINLEEVQKDREAVKDWMEEFGLGSTIFESQLLQDMVEG